MNADYKISECQTHTRLPKYIVQDNYHSLNEVASYATWNFNVQCLVTSSTVAVFKITKKA